MKKIRKKIKNKFYFAFFTTIVLFVTITLIYTNISKEKGNNNSINKEKEDISTIKEDCMTDNKIVFDEDTNKIILELKNSFKNDSNAVSFYYEDLTTGEIISYNEEKEMFAASVTKAPVDIYIYILASEGKIDLNEKLTFTSKHKRGGIGVLKNKPLNTTYSVKELVEYSVIYSDNSAHSMLVSRFGMQNIKEYWQNLGATSIFADDTLFSYLSAKDGGLYMKKLYEFYLTGNDYAKELMTFFKSVKFTLINVNDTIIAHKYGWTNNYLHDSAIVFSEHPYVLTIMSLKGGSDYKKFFDKVSIQINNIHKLLWKNINKECSDN